MWELLLFWKRAIQPLLVPVCFFAAWGLLFLLLWNLWGAIAATLYRAKQMHQIPCTNCVFFTGNYHLKCTVQPTIALSEDAIDCRDYRSSEVIGDRC